MIVPFSMFSSKILASYPTKITASVAAAWALLSPKISCLCAGEYLKINCVNNAANHLLNNATTDNVPATISAVRTA